MEDKVIELQQENKEYKEYVKELKDSLRSYHIKNNKLINENERLKEENNNKAMNDYAHAIDESWYRELYDDYKSRCEKALEYTVKQKKKMYKSRNKIAMFILMKLENILQNGSENNED